MNTRVNKRAAKPVKTPEEAAEAISLIRGILEAEGAAAGVIDFQSTRTAHLILQTRERALRLQVESGQLCNRKEIEDCIAQIARTERDRLQNWPSQVGALVASELGSDIVETIIVLEKHIRVFLTELANPEIHLKSDREAA